MFHRTKSVDLVGWKKEVEQTLEQLEREKRLLITRQTNCLNEVLTLEKELESAQGTLQPIWFIGEQIKSLKTRENLFKKGLENVQFTQREFQKLKNENARSEKHKSIKERLYDLQTVTNQVWHYEITSMDDHPITVGKVKIALALLIVGFLFSHYLTEQMGKQLIRRFCLDEAASFAFQRILHYLLLVSIVLFVLHLVKVNNI